MSIFNLFFTEKILLMEAFITLKCCSGAITLHWLVGVKIPNIHLQKVKKKKIIVPGCQLQKDNNTIQNLLKS